MTCCSLDRKPDTWCELRKTPNHSPQLAYHVSRITFYANPAAFFNAATLSNFSHGASMSVRPKWP